MMIQVVWTEEMAQKYRTWQEQKKKKDGGVTTQTATPEIVSWGSISSEKEPLIIISEE